MPAVWTGTPRDWDTGLLVTAAIANQEWRDRFLYLKTAPTFDGNVAVAGTLNVTGATTHVGTVTAGTLTATGLTTGTLTASGLTTLNGTVNITGPTNAASLALAGGLTVAGTTTLTGATTAGALTASTATVSGLTTLNGGVNVTGATNVGSLAVGGVLTVAGTSQFTGVVTLLTGSTLTGVVTINFAGGSTQGLILNDTTAGSTATTLWFKSNGTSVGSLVTGPSMFTLNAPALTLVSAVTVSSTLTTAAILAGGTLQFTADGDTTGPALFRQTGNLIFRGGSSAIRFQDQAGSANNFIFDNAGNLTVSRGTVTVSGFGVHQFGAGGTGANQLSLVNPTSGAANFARFVVQAGTTDVVLDSFSQGYTTSGYNIASSACLSTASVGGLSFVTSNGSAPIRFYTSGSTERVRIHPSGGVSIGTTNDPGGAILRVSNAVQIGTTTAFATLGTTGFSMVTWLTTASAANAWVGNNDYIRLVTSVRAAKHDIASITVADALRVVAGLCGVTYQSAVDEDQRRWPGLVAEDVEAVEPTLATYDDQGRLQSVAYDRVVAYLLPAMQHLLQRVDALEGRA